MAISEAEVVHVAALARLHLSESEVKAMQQQLSAVLEHFQELVQLDTSKVSPTSSILDIKNVWREDKVWQSLPREQVLAQAPAKEGAFFAVPRVVGESEADGE
jgi:aspartyl-tRNA(Asn)/glutamyl-tRNA(Gln) amidotransferase subunit C